jgi:two-component system, NtrC family, nitrogen regulation response regulator NtrX
MPEKILLVDDDSKIEKIVAEILCDHGFEIVCAETGTKALELIEQKAFDLILLDVMLPDADGIEILNKIMQLQPHVPVVMISGFATIARAVTAVKIGAYDFLEKPFDHQRLLVTVKNALEKSNLEQDQKIFVDDLMKRFGIIGISKEIRSVCALVNRIAKVNTPVLITGENGVGKELIAQAIHQLSERKTFVPMNSAAVPKELIESELFGHKKGAFTGAIADRVGKFQMADGGTLFLDEVGDMCPEMQAKLLRAIETKEVTAVGSSQVQKLDVRVIAATNQDLQTKIASGEFREDLFFRLRGVSIHISPLRERRDDIPILAEYFLDKCNEGKELKRRLSEQALDALKQADWHGNVRELKYFIESLVLFVDDEIIDHLQVLAALRANKLPESSRAKFSSDKFREVGTDIRHLHQYEQELIEKTLVDTGGNITKAAEILKIDRTTLSKKIKRLGLRQ